ncbi:hypothetical protein JCGZ_17026 [Jatropha curcas]|uniref:BSD domain-containing protein n=1 Tax=Jatropha curcas TaxID=180498 RepID=A0A067KEJ6_JATCU|nr:uncharacterized protein LOC105641285 [Jatropha curcas]KDP30244.1 hypothetical protein JCGZ_17026 [Jatropha curcas]
MSWLFKSFQSDDQDSSSSSPESPTNRGDGVKEDLSVIGESIGRQLRGVANFLAPPPSPPSNTEDKSSSLPSDYFSSSSTSQSQALLGIRNDLAEIGGSLKSSLSLLSSNKAVSEISKFTSTFLPFQSNDNEGEDEEEYDDEEDDYVPGITEEVVDFVKEISMRPECWTDFPLLLETDFKMSDAQREHASIVEHLVPSLTALRDNLHSHMDDGRFWMIYFILLLPRLNENDSEILSTPQIIETRSILLQKLQNKRNAKAEGSENSVTLESSQWGSKVTERREENIPSRENEVTDIVNATEGLEIDDEENADQWLKETEIDTETTVYGQKKLEHDEDVSFSDLEDDNGLSTRLSGSKQAQGIIRTPSPTPSGSSDWVQLNESSSETGVGLQKTSQSSSREKDSDGESNDWLKVDDFD